MSIVQTLLPATAAQVAQSAAGGTSTTADPSAAQKTAVQNAVVTGQAAVVTLSSSNSKRAVSHGESRGVDASFEKQEAKEKVDHKSREEKKAAAGSFKATA